MQRDGTSGQSRFLEGQAIFSASGLGGFTACELWKNSSLPPTRGDLRGRPGTTRCGSIVRRGEEHESELLAAHLGLVCGST